MVQPLEPIPGFLASVDVFPPVLALFQYNPTGISDKRQVNYATISAPGTLLPLRQYTGGGDRTIAFSVLVDGVFTTGPGPGITRGPDGGIGPELAKYRAFVHPRTPRWLEAAVRPDGFTGLYSGFGAEERFVAPPACRFGFGERVVDCIVTEVTVTEQLHTATLSPLRAEVAITLVELSPYAAGTALGGL